MDRADELAQVYDAARGRMTSVDIVRASHKRARAVTGDYVR